VRTVNAVPLAGGAQAALLRFAPVHVGGAIRRSGAATLSAHMVSTVVRSPFKRPPAAQAPVLGSSSAGALSPAVRRRSACYASMRSRGESALRRADMRLRY